MYLIDTNIFLEILLSQEKKENCKNFLNENISNIGITDFSLHSIGVIASRNNLINIFETFINDVLPNVQIISLEKSSYAKLPQVIKMHNLDFDDAYQFLCAMENSLKIVTMDKDFERVTSLNEVLFL
ncbi:MAG: PIN domain-containing protein [Bacteroidetes bacterium]|nr:PIN domain-containing protein [Bacteroidota bacterium]